VVRRRLSPAHDRLGWISSGAVRWPSQREPARLKGGIRGRLYQLGRFTRSRTVPTPVRTRAELEQFGDALLEPLFPVATGIRLLGISLSSLGAAEAEREPEFSLPA
jgi:nucleotidyltransferase/DNA polymerase involved in DNA repair